MKQQRTLKNTHGHSAISAVTPDPYLVQESKREGLGLSLEAGVQDLKANGEWTHTTTQSHHQHQPRRTRKARSSFGEEIEVAQRESPSSREGSSYGRI